VRRHGCPVAVEVFEGNTADPVTLAAQIDKLTQRIKLQRVVMLGDRVTSARIEQTLRPAGPDWITALRAPAIKQLAAEGGRLQPSLFDDRDMAEITRPDGIVRKTDCWIGGVRRRLRAWLRSPIAGIVFRRLSFSTPCGCTFASP
jgi:hypothetical protein